MTGFVPEFIPDMRKHQNRRKTMKTSSVKRAESAKKHYLMLKGADESIKLIDTSTEEGKDEFDHLYMEKDFDLVGTIDSCLSISDLVKFIGVGGV